MMGGVRMLWDYHCFAHGVFEAWSAGEEIRCPECGVVATRQVGSRGVLLDFKDEGFPRAWRMWADQHESAARKESENG